MGKIIDSPITKMRDDEVTPSSAQPSVSAAATAIRRHVAALSDLSQFPLLRPNERVLQKNRVLGLGPRTSNALSAYKMIRTRLLHVMRGNGWRKIGITSAGTGEGKSLTAINLALSLSREGNQNVFLIDLDMRRPRVAEYLGLRPPHGVQEFFEGHVAPEHVFFRIGAPGLAIAANTAQRESSSELLSSGKLTQLIEFALSQDSNSILLFDMPPLLLADDAIAVAPSVDGILLVACEGKTKRADFLGAYEIVREFNVAGLILNRSSELVGQYY
jgi:protein-tyrosine kinase